MTEMEEEGEMEPSLIEVEKSLHRNDVQLRESLKKIANLDGIEIIEEAQRARIYSDEIGRLRKERLSFFLNHK